MDSQRTLSMKVDLEIHKLSKSYGGPLVLNDLSLTVFKGQLCCLLGPSGCGKTTILKIINGLLKPDSGTIKLGGKDITDLPPGKRNLGLVFQNYALFPHLDVFENVAYGLRRRRVPKQELYTRVQDVLAIVRLKDYGKRCVHELSGGQQQRVALARALVINPSLLLLDEPLSNLDARLRIDMRREILRIQRTMNLTTIFVTHDQEEAITIADQIAVINKGEVEQVGTPRDIYERPATRFVADFIGRINFFRSKIVDQQLLLFGRHFPVPDDFTIGNSEITCAVRPEHLSIGAPSASCINGIVSDISYHGSLMWYRVQIQSENLTAEVSVEVPSSQKVFGKGDEVSLMFDRHNVTIFEDKTEIVRSLDTKLAGRK